MNWFIWKLPVVIIVINRGLLLLVEQFSIAASLTAALVVYPETVMLVSLLIWVNYLNKLSEKLLLGHKSVFILLLCFDENIVYKRTKCSFTPFNYFKLNICSLKYNYFKHFCLRFDLNVNEQVPFFF